MTKYLTAKQKAEELAITTRGLAKTRHLYKHIKKSPRKYLYFAEEYIPTHIPAPVEPGPLRSKLKLPPKRRRKVSSSELNYYKVNGGTGETFQLENQRRKEQSIKNRTVIEKKELVYFVLQPDDEMSAVKVGKSASEQKVDQRASSCITYNPKHTYLLGYIEGVEKEWHEKFKEHCIHNEWFNWFALKDTILSLNLKLPASYIGVLRPRYKKECKNDPRKLSLLEKDEYIVRTWISEILESISGDITSPKI